MQYAPTQNELYREIHRSGSKEEIALAREFADAEFRKNTSSWACAVERGMKKMVKDPRWTLRTPKEVTR